MILKCIGCHELRRQEMRVNPDSWRTFRLKGDILVTYTCPHLPSVSTTLGGLLRPAKTIRAAVESCPEEPLSRCVICQQTTNLLHYGEDIVTICTLHDKAWGKWLDENPERRAYLAPKGRVIRANWVEVFREFVEDMRKLEGAP